MSAPRARSRRREQGGFTFVEVMLAAVMGLLAIGVAVQSSATADTLASATRIMLQSAAKHRRNCRAVVNVLRAADEHTLAAFDASGRATQPEFQRVTGQAYGERSLGGTERLEWRPTNPNPQPTGSRRLGGIHLVAPDTTVSVIARDVAQDTFYVRREGRNLVIGLSTSYMLNSTDAHVVTTETVVTLRN